MDIQDTSKIIKRSHRESERERDRVSCVLHTSKQHLNTFLQQALYIAPSRTSTNINNKQILTQFVIASGSSCKHITSAFSDANVAILHRLSVMPTSRKCVRRDLLLPVALWPCKNARASSTVYWIVYKLQNVLTLGIWWHYTSGQLLYYNLNILWYIYFVMESCMYTT